MFKRLKQALVESFAGAVALGYLLAQSISYFVNIFTTPVSSWVLRNEYGEFAARSMTKGFSFKGTLPGVLGFLLLSVICYVSKRWLYFKLPRTSSNYVVSNPDTANS